MPEQIEVVITGSGEVRDADGNLLNQPDQPDRRATTEGESR